MDSTLNNANYVKTDILAIAGGAIELEAMHGVKADMPKFTAGIRYFSDANGTPATPGAGTVTISATGLVTGQDTAITNGALDATDVTAFVKWEQNCTKVTATPAGVTTATHFQLHIVQEK